MRRIKRSISCAFGLLLAATLFMHCKDKNNDIFSVRVAYTNADNIALRDDQQPGIWQDSGIAPIIRLEEIPYGGDLAPVILDSGILGKKAGELVLKGTGKEESIYQLEVENGPVLLLINDEEEIRVDIDLSKRDNYYSVSGSEASQILKDFIRQYSEKTFIVNKTFSELDSLKQLQALDSLVIIATGNKNKAVAELNRFLQDFITRSNHPALSLFALGWSSRSFPEADFEKALQQVIAKFPNHQVLKSVKSSYEMQKAQLMEQEKKQEGDTWVGKAVPELALPTAEGNLLSIASFRGKFVLVDFWASWCGPCRRENPNIVKAYSQFKDKNFTILGVSLDREKDAWLKAIKDDGLQWAHVSDLRYWDSKATEIFNIKGIPFNILVDPKGNIIAENLIGFDLEKKLGEVLE